MDHLLLEKEFSITCPLEDKFCEYELTMNSSLLAQCILSDPMVWYDMVWYGILLYHKKPMQSPSVNFPYEIGKPTSSLDLSYDKLPTQFVH